MRARYRILSLLLVLILALGTLIGCAPTDKPLNYLKEALENTLDERFGGEILSTVAEALNGGLVELRYGGADAALIDSPLQSAELKLWMNADEQTVAAAGSATVAGKTYDGRVFLDPDSLVVSSSSFLALTDLGIDFNTLSADLQKSIFRNNSQSEYMIPWLGDSAVQDITALKNGFFTVFSHAEEWALIADDVTEVFLECLVNNLGEEWYSKDGCIYIDISVTNEVLSRTLGDLYTRLLDDGDFCKQLRLIAETMDAVDSAKQGNGMKVTSRSVWVEDFLRSSNKVNEWRQYIANTLTPFRLDLDAVINTSDDLIESASVALFTDPDRDRALEHFVTVSLDLTAEESNVISLHYGSFLRTLTYTVTEDGLRTYKAKMEYIKREAATGAQLFCAVGELNADRLEDFYELILVKGETTRRFTGSFDKKIDGFTFSVDSAAINGESHPCSFYVGVDVDGSPEEAPEDYRLLFNMDANEYRPLHDRATAAVEELKRDWGEASLTPVSWLNRLLFALGIEEEL